MPLPWIFTYFLMSSRHLRCKPDSYTFSLVSHLYLVTLNSKSFLLSLLFCVFVCLYECLFFHLSVSPSVHLSVCPFVHMSVCPFVRLSICPFVDLSDCRFVRLSICPFVDLSICPLVHWSVCSFVHLSVCPFIFYRTGLSNFFLWSYIELFLSIFRKVKVRAQQPEPRNRFIMVLRPPAGLAAGRPRVRDLPVASTEKRSDQVMGARVVRASGVYLIENWEAQRIIWPYQEDSLSTWGLSET